MEKEVFKDIPEYEGLYQISNYGRVKSLQRENIFYCGLKKEYLKRPVKEKILSFNKSRRGYLQVCLTKNGVCKTYTVHRLVANSFIDNKSKLPQVNHIDGNKENNYLGNLEWCTSKENNNHAYKTGLNKGRRRKVLQYDLKNNFIKEYNSITEFLKEKNINKKDGNISACCTGRKKSAYGYIWKYAKKKR